MCAAPERPTFFRGRSAARCAWLTALAGLLWSACLPLRWAPQAARGQLHLLTARQPLEEAARSLSTPAATRALLTEVPRIKAWGTTCGLKPTSNYQHYVALDRPSVAYVVAAAPPLELRAHTWDFPVAGSFPYLGWFRRRDALDHATQLALSGMDVEVRGVSAYSTLGWLTDPILSSMVRPGPYARADLINTVLHESVHATVFLKDAGAFNETLASVVADELTPRYLRHADGPHSADATRWQDAQRQWEVRRARLTRAHDELAALYASPLPAGEKLRRKQDILWRLQADVPVSFRWNNASLMQFRTYDTGADTFLRALNRCEGDVARFLRAMARVELRGSLEQSVERAISGTCSPSLASPR